MSNMSYCRFENTVSDLEECKEVLEEQGLTGTNNYGEMLSTTEYQAAKQMIEAAREIAEQFQDVDLDEMDTEYEENKANID